MNFVFRVSKKLVNTRPILNHWVPFTHNYTTKTTTSVPVDEDFLPIHPVWNFNQLLVSTNLKEGYKPTYQPIKKGFYLSKLPVQEDESLLWEVEKFHLMLHYLDKVQVDQTMPAKFSFLEPKQMDLESVEVEGLEENCSQVIQFSQTEHSQLQTSYFIVKLEESH